METKGKGKIVEVYTIPSKTAVLKTEELGKKFWHIDREMLRIKLHYFLFMGGLGCLLPYMAIFAKNRINITASSLASILITQKFLFIFTRPAIGYTADYFNKIKAIICILSIVQTFFYILLLTIPKIEKDQQAIQSNKTYFSDPYENMNSSHFYVNCASNAYQNPFPENGSFLHNSEETDFCFLSLDYVSRLATECSNEDLKARNVSEILILHNDTKSFLNSDGKVNSTSSISLYSHALTTCKICCKSNRMCQNIECKIPKNDRKQTASSEGKTVSDFETYQFWVYALLTLIAQACTIGIFTLSDTACSESVEKFGAQFGRQRLCGAIGWGLMSPIGGLLNDYTNDFTASWILMAVMSIVSLVNIVKLDLVKPQFSKNILKDVGAVLRSKEFLAFELCILLNGVCSGVLWNYLIWYLATIGGSRFLCGMVQTVQCCIGELPCMFFSGWVIKKIGHFNVVTLSLTCYCIRFFWYNQLWNPWLVLVTECLSGVTFGFFYPTMASYAKLSAKPGTEATTQAVLFTTHEGLGAGIGCVVAGIGFDILGGHRTFFFLSIFAGCGAILSIILNLSIRGQKGSIDVNSKPNK